jgi:hypothetical protein
MEIRRLILSASSPFIKGKLDRFIRWAYEHVRLNLVDVMKRLRKPAGKKRCFPECRYFA